jgi:hypothetical protein
MGKTMSQHILDALNPRHEVMIGWDRPLSNFFLIVLDLTVAEDEEDREIVWLGADRPATELDVDRVLKEACEWAVIPIDLRKKLLADQQHEGRRIWSRPDGGALAPLKEVETCLENTERSL